MVIAAENQNGRQVVILPFHARVIDTYAEGINIKPLFIRRMCSQQPVFSECIPKSPKILFMQGKFDLQLNSNP